MDINIDIIIGLNNEDKNDILQNALSLSYIKPYSVTFYTILKDRKKSILYEGSEKKFYENITFIHDLILNNKSIINNFDYHEIDNLLALSLFLKGNPDFLKNYEAHSIENESLFGVGYNSYSKIRGVGSYQFTNFSFDNQVIHIFNKSNFEIEMYSYILKSFQTNINKNNFKDIFGYDINNLLFNELSYLERIKVIKQDDFNITYIGKKEYTGFYGLLLLDFKHLLYILKNNFHNKNNTPLVKG